MFNIGSGELLLIVIVGLLVVGPKRLPEMMAKFGRALRAFQSEMTKATTVLRENLEETTVAPPAPPPQQVPLPLVPPEVRLHEDT